MASHDFSTFLPEELPTKQVHELLLGAIAPRPIAWVSTISPDGTPNLAPFSYFNVFSSKPPIVVFSPSRRVRDNTAKHTLANVLSTPECVIHIVSHALLHQMVLTSTDFPDGISEFEKAGLTIIPSTRVSPPRIAEAPAALECKVLEAKSLGAEGGAGTLVICEVIAIHYHSHVLGAHGIPDPRILDPMSRLGAAWYSRASDGLMKVQGPGLSIGIGIDALPEPIRQSSTLTGSHLARLGSMTSLPAGEADPSAEAHQRAADLLDQGDIESAWRLLMKPGHAQ